jgi:hypothetical protein
MKDLKHIKRFNESEEYISDADFDGNTNPKETFPMREQYKKDINNLLNRHTYYITKQDFENIISILKEYDKE